MGVRQQDTTCLRQVFLRGILFRDSGIEWLPFRVLALRIHPSWNEWHGSPVAFPGSTVC